MELEREFKIEELFFSETDLNGKISAGNEVFARISGFSYKELIGRPHSIIRHPDMPRVVFKTLWDCIQSNQPIAAFVKNKARDGSYYWVVAYVNPIENGYLSVRFKPSNETVAVISNVYAELRALEKDVESKAEGNKAKAIEISQELLLAKLNALGYESYHEFMDEMFFTEYCRRWQLLNETNSKVDYDPKTASGLVNIAKNLEKIIKSNSSFANMQSEVSGATQFISGLSLDVQRAALNLMIKSEQSLSEAGTLSVIANWLRDGSVKLNDDVDRVVRPINDELKKLKRGLFCIAASRLQIEMVLSFCQEIKIKTQAERGYSDEDARVFMSKLIKAAEITFVTSSDSLRALTKTISVVGKSFSELQRGIMGLSLAHVNGRVECAKMTDSLSLSSIMEEIMTGIVDAKDQLRSLEKTFISMESLMSGFTGNIDEIISDYQKSAVALKL